MQRSQPAGALPPAVATTTPALGGNGVLVTGDDGGTVRRWQVATKLGEQMALMQGGVRAIAAMPGTSQVMLVAEDQAMVVDAASGEIVRRFVSGDQVTALTYVGSDVVISREAWRGDVWLARDPWGKKSAE